MTIETLFQIANSSVLLGWVALIFYPLNPLWADRAAVAVAVAHAALYTVLVALVFGRAEGGYTSLSLVMQLFDAEGVALAGWIHFLCFDLLVGIWITREARRNGLPHWLALICLLPCFLFGPAGFLLFVALRAGIGLRANTA
ncbi:MAG: ABA4-like family protein [Pseudomonadota bacterium]